MTQALFRQEVLQARRGSWLGSISLAQPLPLWVLTGFAALAALAIGLFLFSAAIPAVRKSAVIWCQAKAWR